jgi:hypothetical protein
VSRSRRSRARKADVRGMIEVVMSCIIDEVEVVVDGGPERAVMTDSFGAAPAAPGMNETKASEG